MFSEGPLDGKMRPGGRGRRADLLLHQQTLFSQSLRFVAAGGLVTLTYLGLTTALSEALHLRFQVALAIGMASALTLHFTLQRLFVWRQEAEYALTTKGQLWRYLIVAGFQYGITALATAFVPSALGLPVVLVYLVTAALITASNFFVLRRGVFHSSPE